MKVSIKMVYDMVEGNITMPRKEAKLTKTIMRENGKRAKSMAMESKHSKEEHSTKENTKKERNMVKELKPIKAVGSLAGPMFKE